MALIKLLNGLILHWSFVVALIKPRCLICDEGDEMRHRSISESSLLHLNLTRCCKMFSSRIQFWSAHSRQNENQGASKVLWVRAQRTVSVACLCDGAQHCDCVPQLLGESSTAALSLIFGRWWLPIGALITAGLLKCLILWWPWKLEALWLRMTHPNRQKTRKWRKAFLQFDSTCKAFRKKIKNPLQILKHTSKEKETKKAITGTDRKNKSYFKTLCPSTVSPSVSELQY